MMSETASQDRPIPVDVNNRPGGNLLVVSAKTDAVVQFFDAVTLQKLSDLDMPASTHELALSADGETVFGTVYGGGIFGKNVDPDHRIVAIDVAGRKVAATYDVSGERRHQAPHGVKLDASGLLWVTSELKSCILALDPASAKVVAEIDIAAKPHWLAISHSAGRAFTANKGADHATVVDIALRKPVATLTIPSLCEGVAVSPDGETLFACSHTQPEVFVFDARTLQPRGKMAIEGAEGKLRQLRRVHVSSDQKYVLVSSHVDCHAAIYDYGTLKQTGSVGTAKAPMGFGFAADGAHAYLCCHDDAIVLEMELPTGRVSGHFSTARGCEFILSMQI